MDTPKHTNNLVASTSPYLLQHAHNPVDWYPWGHEALDRAKREDKPIFLSIGYSSCHWCHVMARESFENEEIARVMNEHFVCIKVDREERPDLDAIYMNAVQMMTGSGGWPLSVFLTPSLKPFYGGTYFPPKDSFGRPGLKRVLLAVAKAYRENREQIERASTEIAEQLRHATTIPSSAEALVDRRLVERAVRQLRSQFDPTWAGFGMAPKFPPPISIALLLRDYVRTHDKQTLQMVTLTLDKMAEGGLFDQLGGGFHRYSVDRQWLVPHFEKMLYDNAQLAVTYLEAFRLTKRPLYRRIAKETLDYVMVEMADESGGFYSTLDADSEGKEGKYYLWSPREIAEHLGERDAALFCRYYGVTAAGNFGGQNVLHVPMPRDKFAAQIGLEAHEFDKWLNNVRRRLLAVRAKRVPPKKDDKILADWNGLMISGFAIGYQVIGDAAYRRTAERAADFILAQMHSAQGLRHAYRAGRSHIRAFLDDYAFLIQGLLDLYEATFDVKWIEHARTLAQEMIRHFGDADGGGFFSTSDGQSDLVVRIKSAHDGAVPSGNAVAAHVLLRLAKLTDDTKFADTAKKTLRALYPSAKRSPAAHARLLSAIDFYFGPVKQIVLCAPASRNGQFALLQVVRERYLPNKVIAMVDSRSGRGSVAARVIPLFSGRHMIGGKPTAYVCDNNSCRRPVTNVRALETLLAQ